MESKTGQETAVQIKRTFGAPRQKVYQAWTRPEELAPKTYAWLERMPGSALSYFVKTSKEKTK